MQNVSDGLHVTEHALFFNSHQLLETIIDFATIFLLTSLSINAEIEVTACEGNTVDIRCLFGLINIISANYGRSSKVVCPANNNDVISDVNCGSKKSLKIVRSRCSNKKTCSVKASKDVFGDPCPVTYKYLQVKYECISKWMRNCFSCKTFFQATFSLPKYSSLGFTPY